MTSQIRLAVQAVRLKFRLLTAYDTFWPAVARGGKLILAGRVGEFTRKLFNELPDARDATLVEANRTGPPLFLAGHVLGLGGYDHLVLNVLKGLTNVGVNTCRDRRGCFRKQLVPVEIRPTELTRRKNDPRLAVAPPHLLRRYRPDLRTAAYTMWETDTLPADGVKQLNRCGLVIVPSSWGAACFRANGVKVPIEVVPLGYDPEIFCRAAEDGASTGDFALTPQPPLPGGEGASNSPSPPGRGGWGVRADLCTFGTAGALDEGGLRKNVQRVIDLFRQAFPTDPTVRLRVKITPRSPGVNTHADPRIEVADSHLSTVGLTDWYRSLDAYVNGSFGEGFGLHLLEAMACGVPLISTTFGGVGSFFNSSVGYEVGYELVEARNAIYRGKWANLNDGEMIARMQHVRANRVKARRLGAAAAERARLFRWEDTIRKLVIVLIQHGFIRARKAR